MYDCFLINILNCSFKVGEEDVWKLVLRWSEHNSTPPPPDLLRTVRFGLMDVQLFRREVALHPALENTGIQAAVDLYQATKDTLDQRCLDTTSSIRTPSLGRPRDSKDYIFVFGGWSAGAPLSTISVYNPQFDVWLDLLTQLPSHWAYLGSVYLQVMGNGRKT